MKVLVTGVAGFIGFHVAKCLLADDIEVVGLDSLNDYYDVSLKRARLCQLENKKGFRFIKASIVDRNVIDKLFAEEKFNKVVHLAAQAGVRYSLENPSAYVDSNLVGFGNILEGCRNTQVSHLVFASTSSVYGLNRAMPFSEHHPADHPVSLYAATKKANELMAHSYAHLYGLPVTGLRFFTVYGPWGRPDMAAYLFADAITQGKPIKVFNGGNMKRDFTYIDDIVEGVSRILDKPPHSNEEWDSFKPDPASSSAPYRIYNIGNSQPVVLMDFIRHIEQALGQRAELEFLPMQPGDVLETEADVQELESVTEFSPKVTIEKGVDRFIQWYRDYHGI